MKQRFVITMAVATALCAPLRAQDPEVDLQRVTQKEMVTGDLTAAIQEYKKIVSRAGANRAVAAKALVHIAECYQKMGDAKARETYELVVAQYADQKETVAMARAKLGGGVTPASLATRLLMSVEGSGVNLEYVTPDARLASGVDLSTGDLILRDMTTGANRALLKGSLELRTLSSQTGVGRYTAWSVISPDQRQVVFARYGDSEHPEQGQLWVIPTDPGAKPRLVTRNPEFRNIQPKAWSPDGKSVLARIGIKNAGHTEHKFAWFSMADGSVKVLKSFGWTQWPGYWPKLSPDGRYIAYSLAASDSARDTQIRILAADGSTDTAITTSFTNNDAPVWTADGTHILFLSESTGEVDLWAIPIRDGARVGDPSLVKRGLGLRPLPLGVTRAGSYLYQLTNGGVAYVSTATLGSEARIQESFVGFSPAWSPDGNALAFVRRRSIEPNNNEVVVRNMTTGQEKVYYRDGIGTVPARWFHNGKELLVLAHDPVSKVASLHRMTLSTGTFQQILEFNWNYGVTISPDDTTLYFAGTGDDKGNFNRIFAFDIAARQQKEICRLPGPSTLILPGQAPDRVRLSPDGRTIALHTVDQTEGHIITVNVDGTGYRELYEDHRAAVLGMAWDRDGKSILLGRREPNDKWQIVRIPTEGGAPQFIGLEVNSRPTIIDLDAIGTRLAFTRTKGSQEYWALDNVLSVVH